MKLRIRSQETNETLRIEIPDPSSLSDLKTLIAAKLSPPVSAASIRLSLNRRDELLSPSPAAPLPSLGLTSGDLLFFSLTSNPPPIALVIPPAADPMDQTCEVAESVSKVSPVDSISKVSPVESISKASPVESISKASPVGSISKTSSVESISKIPSCDEEGASLEGDLTNSVKKPPPFASTLKRVMHAELGEARGNLGLVAVAVHAVFLEAGFVIPGAGGGSRLPAGWGTIPYTVGDLRDQDDAKIVTLRLSVAKNYITVYGFVRGGDSPGVRLCLDAVQLAPAVVSAEKHEMSEGEEKDLFRLWKMVRDGLALPLLIDICEANGLPLPPCFARLPTEIKMRIFELLPGADIARAACTGSELRYISSDNDLWERKFQEEFGLLDGSKVEGRNWKEKFAKSWLKMVDSNKRIRRDGVAVHGMRGRFVPGPQRFPLPGIVGGDYDLFPSFGGVGPLGPRLGFPHLPGSGTGFPHLPGSGTGFPHLPGRRNFSPQCNLGERDPSFMDL